MEPEQSLAGGVAELSQFLDAYQAALNELPVAVRFDLAWGQADKWHREWHSEETRASDNTCSASNAAEFGNCVQSANNGRYDGIDVKAPITCDDSTNLCQFTLSRINRRFFVRGTANPRDGFRRSGEHGGYKHNSSDNSTFVWPRFCSKSCL